MTRYAGRIGLSGTTPAHATIEDFDAPDWRAYLTEIGGFDFQPGLVTIEILEGPSAGLFAVGEMEYPEGSQVFPYREGPAVVYGRTPFAPRADSN